jgi:hypothetical protein
MTDAQRQASIKRHERFLTDAERQALQPTEAELIAVDHAVRVAKQTGAWDRLRDQFAIRAELYMEGR